MATEAPAKVEQHTIYQIPLDQRHGTWRDLFTIWFGSNIMMLTIITGSLATAVFKLDFISAVLSIAVGNLVGAIFMALHSAQGPQLGVPQMVQTRGQFGTVGAVLVVAIVIIMYVGFLASNIVLGGQSLHTIALGINEHVLIVFIACVSVIATIFGHDLIHAYTRFLTWASGLALLLTFAWIVLVHGLPNQFLAMNSFNSAGFFSMVSVGALWQIAYAPYVSDYSRYMPHDTGAKHAFWASYWGCSLGSILPMILGAMLGLVAANGDPVAGLTAFTGVAAIPIVIIFSVGIAGTNAMNLYCGVLSTITLIHTFIPSWKAGATARAVTAIIITIIGLSIALFAAGNFLATYTNFILMLLYVLVPWTAINLVDFYLVRHGDYDVNAFFTPEGGAYGRFNKAAIFCYILGIIIQLPFVSTELYTGPIAKALDGVDLSWIVGLCVISPIYYVIAKRHSANKLATV
ncbi:purine-cytosine permease family protein [Acidocella aminolytica]|jgi:NCS1 family nucleobase:cation symporter-1|uniref:Nucleobase cation symporter-1 (NCS1) family/cytosine/purines uracil thiamine allantoin permease n=1 Tax=Acidocella aminolytica 101 = DSM 11237 TaxID=1120923 RepID=A0A0D6PI05_9PROT|nr:cytosine permease [Acidocella aminolytica]GAN81405.1 nucleobase cation symporter-1 (NCS1) family/cytosine/purines uracil thiamine allantoin permease [Acidocella aminolytica 101 = DSM 11237]GBQ40889.1 cytosine/purines/uracil/thiamine/allantoin transporter [Acidocella aminolytica 101 = DSM 11237]SHF32859.1 nucleobase:cation symporter-1, NCS1 family [Acidocella aminolytica 101 = DSM 11237]